MINRFEIHTYGCKVNTYDSGLLEKNLASFSGAKEGAKIHILNTCAVTAEATKEAVRKIRRLKAKDPFCTVVVTGCGAQVDTESFSVLKAADLVVANSHKAELPRILDEYFKGKIKDRVFKSNIFRKEDLGEGGGIETHHTRSFLKIQDGCNSFCTYCVIPYARGKSRSLGVSYLIQKVNEFYTQGINEVVLTGVHIGDYEDEIAGRKMVLEDLIETLLLKTKMPRFRLTSLEPVELSDKLIELFKDPRLCPHFHMSIQSANTKVLKDMKRNYTAEDVESSLLKIKNHVPEAFVGMDVIVGFPTEGDEEFSDTYKRLMDLPWHRIHVFPYSQRPGTRAAMMESVVEDREKSRRASQLRHLSEIRLREHATNQLGKTKLVLGLNAEEGLSRDYWSIQSRTPLIKGHESRLRIESIDYERMMLVGVSYV